MSSPGIQSLKDLSRLREAPSLDQSTAEQLLEELDKLLREMSGEDPA